MVKLAVRTLNQEIIFVKSLQKFATKKNMSLTIDCLYLYFGMCAEIFVTKKLRVESIREKREYYWS